MPAAAVSAQNNPNDVDLAAWLDACPVDLDDAQRNTIGRIVSVRKGDENVAQVSRLTAARRASFRTMWDLDIWHLSGAVIDCLTI